MPAFTVLSRLLLFAGVPLQEYEGWKRAVTTPNLDEALQHLQRMGVEFPGLRIEPDISGDISAGFSQPPTWLVLYLLCYRPSIRTDAQKLSMLASYHLSIAPPPLRPLLVILSAVQLARYNMTAPLTRLVDILLALPGELRAFHIDLLLQVLARSSWYTNATNLIITILEDSSVRHLRLSRRAFTAIFRLLASKHATARLGLSVERYMNLQGHVPALFQLKRLAELFARRRWNRKAARYLERIRELSLNRGSNIVSSGTNVIFVGKSMPHHSRSSTWYLSSFVTPEPLLRYMQRVAIMEEKGQNTSSTSSVDGGGVPESTANSRRSKRLFATPQAWLSMLRVAASHKDTSAETLLQAFEQAQRQQFTPSTTFLIHVIVIKGLLRRGDATNAVRLLDRIPHSERIRSTSVLTVVVETLTMANRGDEAYALLQEVAKPPSPSSSVSRSLVDIQTINTFMVSLHRIGRPDIVFELWDTMEAVFGIIPDNISYPSS
ncbi:hypothetical protein A0H81_05432 [Grifola frondosa]|uniref:Uncharacterized protein n=1 Tax=Grifola frondosa TaxID=5627 RepID=A0A1C7MDG8_GRIFR|nr:hypothetical protein A0H81_05432 [Grifola frondosa]